MSTSAMGAIGQGLDTGYSSQASSGGNAKLAVPQVDGKDGPSSANGSGPNPAAVQKALAHLNQQLQNTNMKVEFDPNAPANQLWLNVVDQQSGKVIQELPPEGLRKFIETQQLVGITFDKMF